MDRRQALDALTVHIPVKARITARRDALRTLMYAEATGFATGTGYRVSYDKRKKDFTVKLGSNGHYQVAGG